MGEKIMNIGYWIAMPLAMLVMDHPKKWVRVMGVLGTLALFPLFMAGMVVWCAGVMVYFFEEI